MIPGVKRHKILKFADIKDVHKLTETYPIGTKVRVWVPSMEIGYGMTIRSGGIMY